MTTQQFKYHVAQAVFQETTFKALVKAINFNKEFLEWCQWLEDMAAEYNWSNESDYSNLSDIPF